MTNRLNLFFLVSNSLFNDVIKLNAIKLKVTKLKVIKAVNVDE